MNPLREQFDLFDGVSAEVQRIVRGDGPLIAVINPVPDHPFGPGEVDLVVKIGEPDEHGIQRIVRLGSFWLVPELLERLRGICFPALFGKAAPLLYAIQEFSSDLALTTHQATE
jgi:hypothetical protein